MGGRSPRTEEMGAEKRPGKKCFSLRPEDITTSQSPGQGHRKAKGPNLTAPVLLENDPLT